MRLYPIGVLHPFLLALPLFSGCAFLSGVDVAYLSNREILADVTRGANLRIDPELFEPVKAEVLEDAVLVHYLGVEYPGDQLWVWRFSRKSSEQEPDSLTDIETFVPLVAKDRASFTAEPARHETIEGHELHWVPYRFDSPVRGNRGESRTARGILAILETTIDGQPILYYFNLDNWGDRASLALEDIRPIVEALAASD